MMRSYNQLPHESSDFGFRRIHIDGDPFPENGKAKVWSQLYNWPARYISLEGSDERACPSVNAYRLKISVSRVSKFRLLVTADQGYWLYLNGARVGERGERGCLNEWHYDAFEVELNPGDYVLGAICWWLGEMSPKRQISIEPAFLLCSPDSEFVDLVSTGVADWQGRKVGGASFIDPTEQLGRMCLSGGRLHYRGGSWSEELGDARDGWRSAKRGPWGVSRFLQYADHRKRLLSPSQLPAMKREPFRMGSVEYVSEKYMHGMAFAGCETNPIDCANWNAALFGEVRCRPLEVPQNSKVALLIRLSDYICAYYRLRLKGGDGARVAVAWAERLSVDPAESVGASERIQIDGRYFVGLEDAFTIEGDEKSELEPLDWVSGCWIRIMIETAKEALSVEGFEMFETGYPLKNTSDFKCSDASLESISKVAFRTLENCSHDTYMDCPFWERLQYLEDARIQALVTYAATDVTDLPQKAISIFKHSCWGAAALPSSSFPANSLQIIPPFALGWINMLRDFAEWRGEIDFVREQLPLAWLIIDQYLLMKRGDGLIANPQGWTFIDTGEGGEMGECLRPGNVSGAVQWKVVCALEALEEVCRCLGEAELSERAGRYARELAEAVERSLWSERRGAFSEDLAHTLFAEHSQALALLSRQLSSGKRKQVASTLIGDSSLVRASGYFSHYVLEAFRSLGEAELLLGRLDEWKAFIEAGLHTFPERSLEGRSDCHAWNAHPSFHLMGSVLGIRPEGVGFSSVRIAPLLGHLESIGGRVAHPLGLIEVHVERQGNCLFVRAQLPEGLSGACCVEGQRRELSGGCNDCQFELSV